jgi:hypothetical protein
MNWRGLQGSFAVKLMIYATICCEPEHNIKDLHLHVRCTDFNPECADC